MATTEIRRSVGGLAISSEAELAADCRRLRKHLEKRQLATPEEIAAHWPLEEDAAPLWKWVDTYGQMMRLKGRAAAPCASASADAAADRAAVAALQEEPEPVPLADGRLVEVHPKGLRTILWYDDRDGYLDWLCGHRSALHRDMERGTVGAEVPDGDVTALVERIRAAEVRIIGEMAAQACSPGPAFRTSYAPGEVERWADASPLDLTRIHAAFIGVNFVRLQLARRLAPPRKPRKGSGERFTWGGFISGVAHRERCSSASVADDRSLASLLLTFDLAAPSDADLEDALT